MEADKDIDTSAKWPTEQAVHVPVPPPRQPVFKGAILATMFEELSIFFQRIQMADAFEKKVTEAAKSPAAWLLLREELNPSKEPTP